ncbi:MAG: HD domain-containing phosphohydrolase [Anaerolineales bacterium]
MPGNQTDRFKALGKGILKRVLFFLAGAVVLSLFSILQKVFVGILGQALLFNPRAYLVPVLYGGITGLVIGEWYLKLRRDAVEIEEREEQLRTLINAMPDFVILKDGAGRWQELNNSGATLFGFENISIADKTDLQLAQEYPDLNELLNWCYISDEETWSSGKVTSCQIESFPIDSVPRSFEIVKVPVYRPDGGRKGLVTIGRDITQIKKSKQMLEAAYDTTLAGWARAVELRDRTTQDHTDRVVALAVKLARLVGLPEEDLVHLRRGAMLHDIGKISMPDAILTKPGALTEEEFRTMQQHPEIAYRLLAHIAFLEKALDIPYCHHERWDGSGYPRGLESESIPIMARIFALADVWDALTSDRPYRSAWSEAKALAYIRENAGTHFDPSITPLFVEMLEAGGG